MEDKQNTEPLELRARPPYRVVKFRKSLIVGLCAVGLGFMVTVSMLALNPPQARAPQDRQELYNTERKPEPEGLTALPGDYAQAAMQKPAAPPAVPALGPPLPGDLGRPILERQRAIGMEMGIDPAASGQELSQKAIQAREAGVFFRIDGAGGSGGQRGASPSVPAVTESSPEGRLALDPGRDQNNQQRKLDFVAQRGAENIYNPHTLQTPVSPYQIMAGSIITASLVTGINSDLPGLVVAQVTENVYDTVTGQILLVPQGARLIGTYDSVVAYGQSRALLVWQRIVMPDGSSVQIDNLPATDAQGYAGLEDGVDYHTWKLLKGVALSTLLGVGTELSLGDEESDLLRAVRESTQQNAAQAGQRLTEKNLNIQPTITIRPGWPVHVIVHKDIVLKPYTRG